ncbi:MAG: sulfite exporter TauE/SafE family protein [Acidimicrobiales bacterium]
MEFSLAALVSGLAVGLVVGVTGAGGGALLTPLLILALHVNAKTAVASDLVASVFMRPVAGFVHLRRSLVHWPIVGWLVAGSVPTAFAGGVLSSLYIPAQTADSVLEPIIGGVLLFSGAAAIARRFAKARVAAAEAPPTGTRPLVAARPFPTVVIGVLGGLAVGVTSVGAGTLMLVALALVYPALSSRELVGTDLVQAVPLVLAAALGHLAAGGLHVSLTAAVVAGGVPGALIGAYLSRWIPARSLGVVVAGVIFGSGCALIGWVPGAIVGGCAAVTLVVTAAWVRWRAAPRAAIGVLGEEPATLRA